MHILSLDIGGTSIKYGVLDNEGKIYEKGKTKTPQENIEKFLCEISNIKTELSKKYNFEGIAMSCPGAVDDKTGIIGGASAIPYIHGFNIKERIQISTGIQNVKMENDANCAALAEVWKGAAAENKDVLFVILGSGVGGAVIKDKKIHKGANLQGGEFGYMIISEEYGILSEAASPVNLAKRVSLRKGAKEDSLDGEQVFKMAEAGDIIALEEIEKFYYNIAVGIYNIQYFYDPEVIVIGGGISSREDILQHIEKGMDKVMNKVKIAKIRPRILKCKFMNNANLIGAVYNYITK